MSFLVNPYRFAVAGPSGDVTIAVQDFSLPDATGTVSVTSAAISGVTPKGVILLSNGDNTSAGESARGTLSFGHVATDDMMTVISGNDNVGTSVNRHGIWRTGRALTSNDWTSGTSYQTRHVAAGALASGGADLNFTTATTALSRRGAMIAFAGADCSAANGFVNFAGSATQTVNCGFQPDAVIALGVGNPGNDSYSDLRYTYGIATANGTQRCVAGFEDYGLADSAPQQAILTTHSGMDFNTSNTGGQAATYSVGSFTSTGFTITRSATGNTDILWLALKFAGRQVTLKDFTTPTATGTHAITGVGFEPQFALLFLTNLEATDPSFPVSSSDLMAGLSVCAIGDEQWSFSLRVNALEATVDVGEQNGNVAVMGASATDCDAISATLTSFDSDGMTLNYSAVQGTAKKGFILFVE